MPNNSSRKCIQKLKYVEFSFFHILVFNLLCRVCRQRYSANRGQIMRPRAKMFLDINPIDFIMSSELRVQRTPDTLLLVKFCALLYILGSQATLDTIVSMCKFGVATNVAKKHFLFF